MIISIFLIENSPEDPALTTSMQDQQLLQSIIGKLSSEDGKNHSNDSENIKCQLAQASQNQEENQDVLKKLFEQKYKKTLDRIDEKFKDFKDQGGVVDIELVKKEHKKTLDRVDKEFNESKANQQVEPEKQQVTALGNKASELIQSDDKKTLISNIIQDNTETIQNLAEVHNKEGEEKVGAPIATDAQLPTQEGRAR